MNLSGEKLREQKIYKATIIGSIINFILIALKFTAGILGHSSAMIADAVHSISDFVTDLLVIIFIRISGKPKDKNHDYGHGKFETLATLFIGFILFFVGLGIAWSGTADIISILSGKEIKSPGILALIVAVVSILSKEALYQYTVKIGRSLKSETVIANAWHHRSDAFSSIATAAGIGGAILLGHQWVILDPLAALAVSFFIIKIAVQLTKPSLNELLEKSLPDEIEKEIENTINEFHDVSQPHNLCTRKIGNYYAIEFHVRMNGEISLQEAHKTITKIENKLKEQYGGKTHVIIHMEPLKV